jgi:hypothetical protein
MKNSFFKAVIGVLMFVTWVCFMLASCDVLTK